MGNIKQKERINKEDTSAEDDVYCVPLIKSRTQELQDRRRQKDMASIADIRSIVEPRGYNLIRSEEHNWR